LTSFYGPNYSASLKLTLDNSSKRSSKEVRRTAQRGYIVFRESIVVGDAGRVMDVIAYPLGRAQDVVGLVDLSGFGCETNVGQTVVDYYLQLRRVSPCIDPVCIFPHGLIDENGQTFRSLTQRLEQLDVTGEHDKLQPKKA
jgi:hypothetical protein